MRRKVFILLTVIFLLNTNVLFAEDQKQGGQCEPSLDPVFLPGIVIALQMAEWYPIECVQSYQSPEQPSLVAQLWNNAAKTAPDLLRGMNAQLVFTVENNIPGNRSGYVRIEGKTLKESHVRAGNVLFVTTPIESFGNRVLIFMGQEGPYHASIYSVDRHLNVEELYDGKGMFSIYGVEVVKPGLFRLQENPNLSGVSGASEIWSAYKNRVFIVDVTKGTFEMSVDLKSQEEAYIGVPWPLDAK